ncbi:MAG: hypothetical protein SPI53_04725 [Erysipelotrichaceae bacterium]|nr:hypothetical protein [Erysipelotrichaceae bacterium]
MKIINFEDIKKLNISPKQCYEWVSDMIENKDKVVLPPKISMVPFDKAFYNVMPSIVPVDKHRAAGVKIVSRYPERKPSLESKLMLFDVESGKFLALMDANWITTMRTGAIAVHSIKLFAKKDFHNIGIIGLGNTARATMLVLADVMPDTKFNVRLLKYKDEAQLFMNRFKDYENFNFEIVDNIEELIGESEVVISAATYFDQDICEDKYFKEGILIVPIHTRGFSNCDLFFDKIYADDYGHVHHFKNFDKFNYFSEVADVVNGKNIGRENNKERILVYNIGLSMHDINFAYHIYELINQDGSISEIDMNDPMDKYWI